MLYPVLFGALVLLVVYLFREVRYRRTTQYGELPQLKGSLVWGHMKTLHEFMTRERPNAHVDYAFSAINRELGNPPVTMLDLRPASFPMCIVNSHEVAEQISRSSKLFPHSTPKSPTMGDLLYLIGPMSILTAQKEEWKERRKSFNPGFAPQHLLSLLPCILDKTWPFLRHLDSYARTGEEFSLDELCTNLTFDIIGAVTMGVDFDAQMEQTEQSEFMQAYRSLVEAYAPDDRRLVSFWGKNNDAVRRRMSRRVDHLLDNLIRQKFAEQQQLNEEGGKKSRSVLSLALQDTPGSRLSDAVVADTRDQLKTFLFAGHDTTSILLQWTLYELSRTPRVFAALRAELDEVFGPDPDPAVVRDALLASGGEDLLRRLTYTSAVLKETLRLWPPAGTARRAPPGSGLFVNLPAQGPGGQSRQVCLDGLVIYNCQAIIQRDPAVYGETANDFVPERWLGNTDTSESTNSGLAADEKGTGGGSGGGGGSIPASAWRPFERGPRNCIGQELVNVEARVILACAVRRYDFVKVGLGESALDESDQPVLNAKGQYEVRSELYNTRLVTAKPVDGTRMKVKLTPKASVNLL